MKILRALFLILVTVAVFIWAVFSWASVPTVYKSTSGDNLVSCLSADTSGQERGIEDPLCQSVLEGQYEIVWVK